MFIGENVTARQMFILCLGTQFHHVEVLTSAPVWHK